MDCVPELPDAWLVNYHFTCTASYTITQDDIDVGLVQNTVRYCTVIYVGSSVCRVLGTLVYCLELSFRLQYALFVALMRVYDGNSCPCSRWYIHCRYILTSAESTSFLLNDFRAFLSFPASDR